MAMLSINRMNEKQEPIIRKIWKNNNISTTMLISIPKELASRHDMKVGTSLLLIDKPEGILFKKLELA